MWRRVVANVPLWVAGTVGVVLTAVEWYYGWLWWTESQSRSVEEERIGLALFVNIMVAGIVVGLPLHLLTERWHADASDSPASADRP